MAAVLFKHTSNVFKIILKFVWTSPRSSLPRLNDFEEHEFLQKFQTFKKFWTIWAFLQNFQIFPWPILTCHTLQTTHTKAASLVVFYPTKDEIVQGPSWHALLWRRQQDCVLAWLRKYRYRKIPQLKNPNENENPKKVNQKTQK